MIKIQLQMAFHRTSALQESPDGKFRESQYNKFLEHLWQPKVFIWRLLDRE